jgi:hypothetical protein
MDWKRVIEINREALVRIVAGLVVLLAAQGGVPRLSLPVYQLIARILLPAESAVRRLIVIAARGLVVPPGRSMPQGIVFAGKGAKGSRRVAFKLFDARKRFSDAHDDAAGALTVKGPRIRIVDELDPRSQFLATFTQPKTPDDKISEAETSRLTRRLDAIKRALDDLPRQAKRMVRWRARRAAMESPGFVSPLRPGAAPGHRKRSRDEIHLLLRECHALARDALRADTS